MAQLDSTANPPPETPQDLCTGLSQPFQFFCSHLGDEVKVVAGSPVLSLLLTALIIYMTRRLFRSHYESLLKNLNEQVNNHKSQIGNLESRINLRNDDIAHMEKTIQQIKQVNEELAESKQIESHKVETPEKPHEKSEVQNIVPEQKPIFIIEELTWELRWAEERGNGSHLLAPNTPMPEHASLQLLIIATIAATPPLEIRDVKLEITSPIIDTLHSDWTFNQTISHGNVRVSFNINSLPPDVYSMKLSINPYQDDGITSDLFIVRINRSPSCTS